MVDEFIYFAKNPSWPSKYIVIPGSNSDSGYLVGGGVFFFVVVFTQILSAEYVG